MDYFNYKDSILYAEDVPLEHLASQFGTPLYVYSKATFIRHWKAFDEAFNTNPHLICYAVKANSNLSILQTLAKVGSGFDIVSGGELSRALKAGGDPNKIVFSGVGKSDEEIRFALKSNILCFNVESTSELNRIEKIASELNLIAPISIRVNPNVDAFTHPYISTGLKENKFGVSINTARTLYATARASKHLDPIGIDCHIGSQLTKMEPLLDALEIVLDEVEHLRNEGIEIKHLDMGGGLGVQYRDETPPHPSSYAEAVSKRVNARNLSDKLTLILEPGRAIAANAGVLLTRVEYIKSTEDKAFLVIDAAMNDLLRPSLYESWQDIIPVTKNTHTPEKTYDVVGPVCETGDFLGKNRNLSVKEGELLAIRSSGAYGFSMASNYNSRGKPAEVLVDGDQCFLIRKRETIEDQMRLEPLLEK